jgi:uncharacterized protein YjbI with pentapeptide repeats
VFAWTQSNALSHGPLAVWLVDTLVWRAHLERADLGGAHLEGANFRDAHLEEADLSDAHLDMANLRDAHLEGVDLRSALGLSEAQLVDAHGDARTLLPFGMARPAHWPPASTT